MPMDMAYCQKDLKKKSWKEEKKLWYTTGEHECRVVQSL